MVVTRDAPVPTVGASVSASSRCPLAAARTALGARVKPREHNKRSGSARVLGEWSQMIPNVFNNIPGHVGIFFTDQFGPGEKFTGNVTPLENFY